MLTRRFYKITWDDDFVLPGIAMVNDYEPPSDDGLCAEPTAKDNAAFIVEARTGWPAAIRRAMAAEAELERLRAKPQPRKGRAKAKPLQRKG